MHSASENSTSFEPIWRSSYPAGVPHTIAKDQVSTLIDLFQYSVAQFPDHIAFSNFGFDYTFKAINQLTYQLASYLQMSLGSMQGQRVAIMLPNLIQYPISVFAILNAGHTVVNFNPSYTPREIAKQLNDSGAQVMITLEDLAPAILPIVPQTSLKHLIITRVTDLLQPLSGSPPNSQTVNNEVTITGFLDACKFGQESALLPLTITPQDIAFLQYTGGTTGIAKGAILTHGNLVANVSQALAWIQSCLQAGEEVIVTALPFYHIFALTINCLTFFKLGARNHLITNPRDLKGLVRELQQLRFSCFTGVNSLFNSLINTPGFVDVDFSNLKITIGGGMAVQQSVAERWQQITGSTLSEGYGLTETSPLVSINPLDLKNYNGTIGLPVPSTECSIQDEAGNLLPCGAIGELCVRGPQVMLGYWNRPEETAEVFDQNNWLHTGDLASMDERGYIKIVDRKKDMIIVSGYKVFPNEVEDIVAAHPKVHEVAAIGVPDSKTGESVCIVIVKKDPNLTLEEIRQYCRTNLASFKVPRFFEFWDELPKTNVGKILRREIRERINRSR